MAAVAYIKAAKLIELLKDVDPERMVVSVLSGSKLAIGREPITPYAIVDLVQERLVAPPVATRPQSAKILKVVV